MTRRWQLVNSGDLYTSDLVRTRRSYPGEEYETESGTVWEPGMPEIKERWHVEKITRAYVHIARVRRDQRSGIFEETGEREKVRRGSPEDLFLVALFREEPAKDRWHDDRWMRFGLDRTAGRALTQRPPARPSPAPAR